MQLRATYAQNKLQVYLQVVIITVYRHKTGSQGPAYLTISDSRVYEIMKLYAEFVRPKFFPVKSSTSKPENVKLPFFVSKEGKGMKDANDAVKFFKQQVVDAGSRPS